MAEIKDFLRDQYAESLVDRVDDYDTLCREFATGWETHRTDSGLSVPRYLDIFEEELRLETHSSFTRFSSSLESEFRVYMERYITDHPNSTTARMFDLQYRDSRKMKKLYMDRDNDELHLPFLLFFRELSTKFYTLMRANGPEVTLDRLNGEDLDEPFHGYMLRSLDFPLYSSARYDRDVSRGAEKLSFASSDVAKRALRSAYDRRLLFSVLRSKQNRNEQIPTLIEFASTPAAREEMLGHLALVESGNAPRSVYGGSYKRVLSDNFFILREIERTRKRHEEFRARLREAQEESRKAREASEKAWEKLNESLNSLGIYDEVRHTIDTLIRRAPFDSQLTLRTIPHDDIDKVIHDVENLRSIQPKMSARQIFVHFHRIAQLETATPDEVERVKILDLFLGPNKSKTAILPF